MVFFSEKRKLNDDSVTQSEKRRKTDDKGKIQPISNSCTIVKVDDKTRATRHNLRKRDYRTENVQKNITETTILKSR